MSNNNPRSIILNSPMSRFQIIAVGVCMFLNALDGFDVLAISFASPGIATDWGINRAQLGVVLSMELIGMAVGSIFLGGIADRFGRRPTIMGCLVAMTTGMMLAGFANSIYFLLMVRFLTGLGIGGMLASINAMVSEYANAKSKNLCVMLMAAGFPLGAIIGGSVASALLSQFDWRAVFIFGGSITGLALILVFFLLPESIEYLVEKRPKDALAKINYALGRMKHNLIDVLPKVEPGPTSTGFLRLFKPDLIKITTLLTICYFFYIMAFYYFIKWIPKIVVDMEYAPSTAGSVLVWANVGGALGALFMGLLSSKVKLKNLIIIVMVMSFVMLTIFGLGQSNLFWLCLVSACTGFCINSGIVGLYALFIDYFPASVRASGTGFVIGAGRGGAAFGPIIAGLLFTANFSLFQVSLVMAISALLAAITLFFLGKPKNLFSPK